MTDEIIFIFPTWWFNISAILKGFLIKLCIKTLLIRKSI
ncbi:NAD(P)H-dependent oxidoreductase [endosymbiont 'TC1' of Trimyema compressum]